MRHSSRVRTAGFTIIELVLVLTVVGFLFAYMIPVFQKNKALSSAQGLAVALSEMQSRVGHYYAQKPSFSSPALTSAFAVTNHLAPSELISGVALQTPEGRSITLAAGAPATLWTITFSVSQPLCAVLASQLSPTYQDIKIGGTSVYTPTTGFKAAAAATACANSGGPATFVLTSS